MKLISVGVLFGPLKKSSKNKKNSSNSRSNAAYSSSSDESTTSPHHQFTPRSILSPAPPRSKASSSGSDDYWPSASTSVSEIFTTLHRDGGSRITRRELEAALLRLGPDPPTEEEVASMVAEVDRDGDGSISLADLSSLGATEATAGDELWDAFAVFDADGDGRISAEELMGVFRTLGDDGCTLDDCRRMIGGVDTDGDGFVCFEDFARMMDGQR